jgi:hypothetical protein
MVICAGCLHPNPVKVPNFQHKQDADSATALWLTDDFST